MKTIIAGSRTITNYQVVANAIRDSGWFPEITMIVSGCAKGVDQLALRFAEENNINTIEFPANWNKYGLSAGYKRNVKMAAYGDSLIAIWDGKSKGTMHMIDIMRTKGKPVYIHKP